MTKPGYTHVIMSVPLKNELKDLAKERGCRSIAQLLTQMVSVKVDVNVGVSINTGINTTTINKFKATSNEPEITNQPQNNPQTPFSLSTGSLFAKRESVWCDRRDLDPGQRLGRPTILWSEARNDFADYLKAQEYDVRTGKDMVSYLDKYSPAISSPLDVNSLFSRITVAKRHVVLGLRVLFNFYEALGVDKVYLDSLRKALPHIECGVDLKIPVENKIVESLRRLPAAPLKYQALYNLLLDSGLRLIEGIELIGNFEDAELIKGFYRCDLAMFRGEKQAYYGHFTPYTLELIKRARKSIMEECATSHYFSKYRYVMAKYLRKFAFDKMIELEVPESVADFIEGRVPHRIGAKHYMALARQASKFYPRYAKYVAQLRKKVLS